MPISGIFTIKDVDLDNTSELVIDDIRGNIYLSINNDISDDNRGFYIKYVDQTIEYKRINEITASRYTFKPSGVRLSVYDFGMIRVDINGFSMSDYLSEDGERPSAEMADTLNGLLAKIIKETTAQRMGRDLISVARIGKDRQLPESAEGEIGAMLTGEEGFRPLVYQTNTLKQKMGISLAPRGKPTAIGGKRNTRKRTAKNRK